MGALRYNYTIIIVPCLFLLNMIIYKNTRSAPIEAVYPVRKNRYLALRGTNSTDIYSISDAEKEINLEF
jgi:hypothetical protein